MADDLKPATRRAKDPVAKAAKLLADARDTLEGIGGEKADIWIAIAARVEDARLMVEKHK